MSDSFNPEKPNSPSRSGRGIGSFVVVGALIGLLVVMLFALVIPRGGGDEEVNWIAAIGAGVLAFLIAAGIGYARSNKTQDVEH